MSLIELTKPRVIVMEERGKQYALTLGRITKKQWLRYFEGIVSTSENQAGKRIDLFDNSSALTELVESALIDATGYQTADNVPVTSVPAWQQMIPMRHRQGAGNALLDVERAEPADDLPLALGAETVYLNAVWGADQQGRMWKQLNLMHRFKTPSQDHLRRYSRDAMRSVIVGGSRRGVTKWLGVQATLADLYDELVLGVKGYQVNGEGLSDDREAIAAEMDTCHKVAAAGALFAPATPNVVEEEK